MHDRDGRRLPSPYSQHSIADRDRGAILPDSIHWPDWRTELGEADSVECRPCHTKGGWEYWTTDGNSNFHYWEDCWVCAGAGRVTRERLLYFHGFREFCSGRTPNAYVGPAWLSVIATPLVVAMLGSFAFSGPALFATAFWSPSLVLAACFAYWTLNADAQRRRWCLENPEPQPVPAINPESPRRSGRV